MACLLRAAAKEQVGFFDPALLGTFGDLFGQEILAQLETLEDHLAKRGLIARKGDKTVLLAEGKKRLDQLRLQVAGARSKLAPRILAVCEPAVGTALAKEIIARADAVFSLLERLKELPDLAIQSEMLDAILSLGLLSHLEQSESILPSDISDVVDRIYSRAVRMKNQRMQPDAPKIPHAKYVLWEKIDRGLFHGRLKTRLRFGPIRMNLLRINPKHQRLQARILSDLPDKGRSLTALCKKEGALCGTSGGFFLLSEPGIGPYCKPYDPVGLIINDRVVLNPPVFARPALLVDQENRVFIRRIGMKGLTIGFGKAKFLARKINAPLQSGEIGVFTSFYGSTTPDTGTFHIAVVGTKVVDVSEKPTPIPLNGFVAVINPGQARMGPLGEVAPGDAVDYTLPSIKDLGTIVTAMAGGPQIVSRGKKVLDPSVEQFDRGLPPSNFYPDSPVLDSLLPRMAWGITRDFKLIVCAVDGRNIGESVGMPLSGLADWMIALGCAEVINFDGGSSLRMVVRGQSVDRSQTGIVVEGPSKSSKRPVSTAWLIQPHPVKTAGGTQEPQSKKGGR